MIVNYKEPGFYNKTLQFTTNKFFDCNHSTFEQLKSFLISVINENLHHQETLREIMELKENENISVKCREGNKKVVIENDENLSLALPFLLDKQEFFVRKMKQHSDIKPTAEEKHQHKMEEQKEQHNLQEEKHARQEERQKEKHVRQEEKHGRQLDEHVRQEERQHEKHIRQEEKHARQEERQKEKHVRQKEKYDRQEEKHVRQEERQHDKHIGQEEKHARQDERQQEKEQKKDTMETGERKGQQIAQ